MCIKGFLIGKMKGKESKGSGPLYTGFIVLYLLVIHFLLKIWVSLPVALPPYAVFWGGVAWVIGTTLAIFVDKRKRRKCFFGLFVVAITAIISMFLFWKRLPDAIRFALLDCNWVGIVIPLVLIVIVLGCFSKMGDVRTEFDNLLWIKDAPGKVKFVLGAYFVCILIYTCLYWIVRPDSAALGMQEKKNFLLHLVNFGCASFLTILVGMTVYFKDRREKRNKES